MDRLRKRSSLVTRIALPFSALLVLMVTALSVYLSGFIQDSYLEILKRDLQPETSLVADRISAMIQENATNAAIQDSVQRYARLLGVRVTVISPLGIVLGESDAVASEMENHLGRPEVQRALLGVTSTELRYSKTLHKDMLYAAAPILINDQFTGIARLAVSLDAIHQKEAAMLRTVLFATLVAAGLAVLLAFLVAGYTVSPLKELTDTVQRVADGHLDEISATTRRDEIGQLQRTFQYMANQLRDQIVELSGERGKLEAVLRNMTDGVIIVDETGAVQLVNPAALRIFTSFNPLVDREAVVHKSLIEVVRHHEMVELWRKCHITGEQQTAVLETAPEHMFVQGIATPLGEALPDLTLLVFQDLTRVRKLETVRRDFVSNVSHELRTPLASLKALVETLQEGALEDPPAARRFLSRMDTEIDNLTQMVRELLELTRIESNRFPLRRVVVQPCDLATPAVEGMQLQAERAKLQLRMECLKDLPNVLADPERIEQVLVNLIHNAIKFTQPGGEIVLTARLDQRTVVFALRDRGVGIPPDALTRIFERFYKADRSRSGGGTGLGLSIARHIIEAHGGRIWAESTLGDGSTFFFTLPLA